MRRRSQAVQRNLPRPQEVNASVLRPSHADTHLSDQQKAEELIKREIVLMLHYDALHTPMPHPTRKSAFVFVCFVRGCLFDLRVFIYLFCFILVFYLFIFCVCVRNRDILLCQVSSRHSTNKIIEVLVFKLCRNEGFFFILYVYFHYYLSIYLFSNVFFFSVFILF